MVQAMFNVEKEIVVCHLRSQIEGLSKVLRDIEDANDIDENFTGSSLRNIEVNLRRIRRFCARQ
ncbi:MAG: hypothetical protein COV72_07320 [Candidatus Omnitrophica bacterium CG11_big_fil_rev_8_21_14_0_20_42_13]|uniref:Uncharacterized protein n=1 Tax=Candidatus Ghiorseimicrobium undicola TaxID=1974746 RepID=A0A2H0LY68_9BACT|nr:MAG: hypothetical protein COV72_07320 [Candidatus Omnitrophica bacterium CG11_big_fil_rev_8_21_14_0_20_42_13]